MHRPSDGAPRPRGQPTPLPEQAPLRPGSAAGALTAVQRLRERGRLRGAVPLLGPAFVAAVAYVDPGNFATNFAGGARYGYLLLWVVLTANLMAMLVQSLSAKAGLATGRNLPELCREHYRRPVVWVMWAQAELVAMATDLAEVVGGAVALNLLFGLPLLAGGVATGAVAFAMLALQTRGYRRFELVIGGLFAVVLLGFLVDLVRVGADVRAVTGGLVPHLAGTDSVLLATGIVGATVMPHVIYAHSALSQQRVPAADVAERRHLLRHQRLDVVLAMGLAGLVNMVMLVLAARLFHRSTFPGADTIEGVYAGLGRLVGHWAALAFALALLASGLASAGVGTYAGQVVMQGFLRRGIPLLVRRSLTLAPALAVLAVGADPTRALVLSQVVLSFGVPFALVPLVMLTRRRDVMADLVNSRLTTAAGALVAAVIIGLNAFLLLQSARG